MTNTIQIDGDILAILITSSHHEKGSTFFSPDEFPLQLGLMKREAGYKVEPHYHQHQQRQITGYQEVLFIRSGKVKIEVYTKQNKFAASRMLSAGDCVLFASGGHSVEIIEDAEIIEVKQGPFMGDEDKVFMQEQSKKQRR